MIPLITYKGSAKLPRIRIDDEAPANPEVPTAVTPGALPAIKLDRFPAGIFLICSVLTEETAPVRFTFFCVP
ncbi:hypothetical protein D3C78_1567860 [compost metagenome]